MAARSISMRSPTCRWRHKGRFCGSWSTRPSCGSAAQKVKVDVRVVSSTSRDLERSSARGASARISYHRLSVVPVRVPAFGTARGYSRAYRTFRQAYLASSGQPLARFAEDATAILQTTRWPGNVRQLRNNRRAPDDSGRAASRRRNHRGDAACRYRERGPRRSLGFGGEHLMALPLREAREAFERDYLAAQLARFGGNISTHRQFRRQQPSSFASGRVPGPSTGSRRKSHKMQWMAGRGDSARPSKIRDVALRKSFRSRSRLL